MFETKDSRKKYCSQSCSAKVSNRTRNRVLLTSSCAVCSLEIPRGRRRCDEHRNTKTTETYVTEDWGKYHKDRLKSVYPARKAMCLEYLGGCCVVCGDSESLEFDHVDPSTKVYTITSRLAYYSWDKLLLELSKCQLLCRDCHIDKTTKENSVVHGGGVSGRKNCPCTPCKERKSAYQRERYSSKA